MGTIVICRGHVNAHLIFPVETLVTHATLKVIQGEMDRLNEELGLAGFRDTIIPLFVVPDPEELFSVAQGNLGFFGVGCGIFGSFTDFLVHIMHGEISNYADRLACALVSLDQHRAGHAQSVRRVVEGKRTRLSLCEEDLLASVENKQREFDAVRSRYDAVIKACGRAHAMIHSYLITEAIDRCLLDAKARQERLLAHTGTGGKGVRVRRK